MPKPAADILLEPVSHEEAARWIQDKPLVSRQVFDSLLPELRARAFLISGLEDANVLAEVRGLLASVPRGADWVETKKAIMARLGPWITSDGDGRKAADARAELLLRTHGFQAYQVANHRVMKAQANVFTFWQYLSLDDEKVRPGHAALNGKVVPANSPFWDDHSPPWQWGCRCRKVALLPEEAAELQKAEAALPPEKQSVLSGPALGLAEQGRLFNAAGQQIDIKSDRQKGKLDGFIFDPEALTLPLDQLKGRYDPVTWADFEAQAAKNKLEDGRTVLAWLQGAKAPKVIQKAAKKAKAAAVAKVAGPVVKPGLGSSTVEEAFQLVGIDPAKTITEAQAAALIEELKEDFPADIGPKLSISFFDDGGLLNPDFIKKTVQDFVDLVPPDVVASLPPVDIFGNSSQDSLGTYSKSPGNGKPGVLFLSKHFLAWNPQEARRTIFHELTHWVHRELPPSHPWVAEIKAHFQKRTAGEKIVQLGGYAQGTTGKRDHWYDSYAGRIYHYAEEASHLGLEFPTRMLELLFDPRRFAEVWNVNAYNREDIQLALKGLFPAKP